MRGRFRQKFRHILIHLFIIIGGFAMVYPLVWMFFSAFKTNTEIFGSIALFPQSANLDGFIKGWRSSGQYTFKNFFFNTFTMVIPTVAFTIISCPLAAYGFSRFCFTARNTLFNIMIATLMLPGTVIIIPRYILFRNLSWLNSYMPFWIPALFACYPFFIFMMVQFFRGIPRELDESAYIDGCNSFWVFLRIHIPLLKPALISVVIFQFMWTWNDFYNPLIYISSVRKYPVSLALRMGLDMAVAAEWNQILAMALVSIVPVIILFFSMQKYFVEGIATTGFK